MRILHDLGGMHGFGPIDPEVEDGEPVFHADWERLALGLVLACGALVGWTIDHSRHSRGTAAPIEYLSATYDEKWLAGLEVLLVETEVVMAEELASGRSAAPAPPALVDRRLLANRVSGRGMSGVVCPV